MYIIFFYQDQLVRTSFLEILQEIKKTRPLEVTCGRVKDHDENPLGNDERSLLEEDPVLILMEFGKLMGFRLIDLFAGENNMNIPLHILRLRHSSSLSLNPERFENINAFQPWKMYIRAHIS